MRKALIIFVVALIGAALVLPTLRVLAADSILTEGDVGTTNLCAPIQLFKKVVNYALAFLAPIMIILIIVGGIFRILYGADKKNLEKSNAIIKGAIIGFIIVLLAWTIITFIIAALGFQSLSQNWFEVKCPDSATSAYDWPKEEEENTGNGDPNDPCTNQSGSGNCNQQLPSGYKMSLPCSQTSQMSGTLQDKINCLQSRYYASMSGDEEPNPAETDRGKSYSGIGIGTSIGENSSECFSQCTGNDYTENCTHIKGSNHYGCPGQVGSSYAIDITIPEASSDREKFLNWVAIASDIGRECGVTEMIGPDESEWYGITTQDQRKRDRMRRDHQNHIHMGFCNSPTGEGDY